MSEFHAGSAGQIAGVTNDVCQKCGGAIFAETNSCAACLLETGLDSPGETDLAIFRPRPVRTDFGDYDLLEEIGRGGQGVVYRARQKSLHRVVALKVIALGHWAAEAHLRRFRLEAETIASLDQTGIVPIYEVGEYDGHCYFTMKFIEGQRLDQMVQNVPKSNAGAAKILTELAQTVHYAHERGVLHRDIKPGNVLIDANGKAHLTDFGLAKLIEEQNTITSITNTQDLLGTPSYMAPEQIAGAKELTSATDVYGLGAVLFEMLAGRAPFVGNSKYELIRQVLEKEPTRPRLLNGKADIDLETVCLKCLEKDPARRYRSALALAEDLERWLRDEPIHARPVNVFKRTGKWVRRHRASVSLGSAVAAVGAMAAIMIWNANWTRPSPSSIAVLPFQNLSDANESDSLPDGIQDDILTKLAKIADLKVISRTSVMQYRGVQDVRRIGQALNASHVLEGSVRKAGAKIHLNAQLIDTRSDTHLWAEQYDYESRNTFAVQTDVVEKVAKQLRAKISLAEKLSIEQPPTNDLPAFELYTQAKNLFLTASYSNTGKEDLLKAVDLLDGAIARDASFFQAYCQLASIHDLLYILGHDHTPARLAAAETAIEMAFRLRPEAGEAHLARAENLFRGYLDYSGALAELDLARESLPNDPRVYELKAYIDRRQGKYEEALLSFQRAADLDPRNVFTLQQMAGTYGYLRRYADEESTYDRAVAIDPNDIVTKDARAYVELEWKADTRPLHQLIESILTTNPKASREIADTWLLCALDERDPVAARNALIAAGDNTPLNEQSVHFNRPFVEGVLARMSGDERKARMAFAAARVEQEQVIQAQPNYAPPLCVLGLIDAALGRKAEALREGRRAVELVPVEKDATNGPLMIKYLAMIAAWAGEKDLAVEQLTTALRQHGYLSYGEAKLLPLWDPLRGDPRFEKIVSSLAPK